MNLGYQWLAFFLGVCLPTTVTFVECAVTTGPPGTGRHGSSVFQMLWVVADRSLRSKPYSLCASSSPMMELLDSNFRGYNPGSQTVAENCKTFKLPVSFDHADFDRPRYLIHCNLMKGHGLAIVLQDLPGASSSGHYSLESSLSQRSRNRQSPSLSKI